jgi:acyl-CoA dehydrogenase
MKSPGIEVRRSSRSTASRASTRSIFTDLRIPTSQRLGAVGQGWKVSLTTLMNERMSIGAGMPTGFPELLDLLLQLRDG